MTIYGLSGKSGTGKSYHSQEICGRLGLEAMIDDGLLIYDNNIAAGKSAKREATKIGAIKCAIFTDDDHCEEVKAAIRERGIESILILGTSDKMVDLIAERLELPTPVDHIHIEDVITKGERRIAQRMRKNRGTHVIPAPTLEVKKQFSGYFIDARKGLGEKNDASENEKTVIRPTYSYLGNFEISGKAIMDIVSLVADKVSGIASVLWVANKNTAEGMFLRVIVLMDKGVKIRNAALELQRNVAEQVEHMTDFNVLGVDVEVHGFALQPSITNNSQ